MADLSEVWTAICDRIVGDATILALLGGSTNDERRQAVVYAEGKRISLPAYPAIRVGVIDGASNRLDSGLGRWEVMLQVDVFGAMQMTNWRLVNLLNRLLDIPRGNSSGLTTSSFVVTEMVMTSPASPVGEIGIKDSQQRDVKQLAMTWTLKITQTQD